MSELVKVDFYGDSIWAEPIEGDVLVAVKPIIDSLGLAWNAQLERIKRDEVLAEGMRVTRIPSPGGDQETVALALRLIPGFLFGISTERIADPEGKAKVLAYKRECHAVLYAYFFGTAKAALPADPTADWDWPAIMEKIKAAREIRLLHGKKAGQAFWAKVGLSGRVQASVLFAAYQQWAIETKSPAMTLRSFGETISALGIEKAQSQNI